MNNPTPGTKMFAEYHSPASPANLRLWRGSAEQGLLAEYDEWSGSGKSVRHRAYWLPASPDASAPRGKPPFVSPKQSAGLQPIPVVLAPVSPEFVPSDGFYAMLSSDGLGFTLYWRTSPGSAKPQEEVVRTYQLPVYEENRKAWLSVLLTPPLIILTAAILCAIVALIIYANSCGN